MPVLREWNLTLEVDAVLRGLGSDPASIRARRPQLVAATERAIQTGLPLLRPAVAYERFLVESLRHRTLNLDGGVLSGALIAGQLAHALQVIVMVCTVGDALEQRASQVMADDPVLGLALDGVGSAAVETLATAACQHFEDQAAARGMQITIPLSPGMTGWTVAEGQPQIFALVDAAEIGVTLAESGMMVPRKSISLVVGMGQALDGAGRPCDYCDMRGTCRYQAHYPAET